jgi:hypothetical protein
MVDHTRAQTNENIHIIGKVKGITREGYLAGLVRDRNGEVIDPRGRGIVIPGDIIPIKIEPVNGQIDATERPIRESVPDGSDNV